MSATNLSAPHATQVVSKIKFSAAHSGSDLKNIEQK